MPPHARKISEQASRVKISRLQPATARRNRMRSEEHTSESSHGYISYAVFCLKKKNKAANTSRGGGDTQGRLFLRAVQTLDRHPAEVVVPAHAETTSRDRVPASDDERGDAILL